MGRLFLLLLIASICAEVLPAQTQLLRSVVGNGGALAAPSTDGSTFISSTIGQTVIFTQTRTDGTVMHQGFWVPLDLGIVGVDEEVNDAVAGDVMNYPNPFSGSTTIRFTIPMDGRVTIRVFNLLGDLVRTINADVSTAGSQEIAFNAVDNNGAPLATGTYMYEVEGTTASGASLRRVQRLNILR
ncbi:MAG TPA: FlgD immunoglobulin-like domain containing protein [Candidatus Didemnitutus sp.]|nr:FlgD immunoglobulin-like domain containing protein [Candidatus Didemnitutus sp.]